MKNEAQARILTLLQYLYYETDEKHPVSVQDILKNWRNKGIMASRKSVYNDIALLIELGVDIVCIKSTQNRYFIGSRLFELPELKLLVDAVESSHFVTPQKSRMFIQKLGHLASSAQATRLNRPIYMDGMFKPENEAIYYIVDTLQTAIQESKQISFQYYEHLPTKEKVLKHEGYRYQFSPYSLIWNRDFYYVVGWSEKHNKIAQFRVDRITGIELLALLLQPVPYIGKIITELTHIALLCRGIDLFIFGYIFLLKKIMIISYDDVAVGGDVKDGKKSLIPKLYHKIPAGKLGAHIGIEAGLKAAVHESLSIHGRRCSLLCHSREPYACVSGQQLHGKWHEQYGSKTQYKQYISEMFHQNLSYILKITDNDNTTNILLSKAFLNGIMIYYDDQTCKIRS